MKSFIAAHVGAIVCWTVVAACLTGIVIDSFVWVSRRRAKEEQVWRRMEMNKKEERELARSREVFRKNAENVKFVESCDGEVKVVALRPDGSLIVEGVNGDRRQVWARDQLCVVGDVWLVRAELNHGYLVLTERLR